MKKMRILSLISIIVILCVNTMLPVSAESVTSGQFSLQPTERDLEILNSQPTPPPVEAWTIGLDGKKQSAQVISTDELLGKVTYSDKQNKSGKHGVTPMFYEDYGSYIYSYEWENYVQNYNTYDMYHFYQGQCSFSNRTQRDVTLSYTQQNSNTSTWQVTGKVEVESSFKVAILGKIQANIGVEVASTSTSQVGETIGASITVQPNYIGYISRYKAGAQSGGAGCWHKYKVIKASGQVTDLGYYYESGSAYAIVPTDSHWQGWTDAL